MSQLTRWNAFETRVPGKWVLAGEHSVLRGAMAVAMPHPEFSLSLKFAPGGDSLRIEPANSSPLILELLASIQDRWHSEDKSFQMPQGELKIASSIPVGAGMGSSAALCVAITRWLSEPLTLPQEQHFEFARELEHRFHGRSSGMDIAATLAAEPISFFMETAEKGLRPIGVKQVPRFTFHDTSMRARTSDCVSHVQSLRETRPADSMRIDEQMGAASRMAMEGLVLFDRARSAGDSIAEKRAVDLIAQAMKQAQLCFEEWGLMPKEAKGLEEMLVNQGARAVKLTGAGGGGMLVAIWD